MAGFHFGTGFWNKGVVDPCAIPPGWSYLHDNVTGGILSLSQQLCYSAYSGQCVRMDSAIGDEYGFCQAKIDRASLIAASASDRIVWDWYNQFGAGSPAQTSDTDIQWNNTDQDLIKIVGTSFGMGLADYPQIRLETNDAFSFVYVFKRHTAFSTGFETYFFRTAAVRDVIQLCFIDGYPGINLESFSGGTGDTLRVRSNTRLNTVTGDTNIIAFTYDGSGSPAGVEFYVNDMTTPTAKTTILNTLSTGSIGAVTNYVGGRVGSSAQWVRHFVYELHAWPRVLNSTERNQIKSDFQQTYTFP